MALSGLLLGVASLAQAQARPSDVLPPALAAAWQATRLPLSSLSLWVQPVDADHPVLAVAADQPRRMASVMKLVSTGVALQTLGPAWSWQTPVGLGGPLDAQGVLHGPLHVRGSGDPSLDAMRLRESLQLLREMGLQHIRGDVLVDRSLWRLPPHDPAAFDGEPLRPYNAGPDPWLLAHHAVTLRWRLAPGQSIRPELTLSPPLQGVTLRNLTEVQPQGPCGDWRSRITLNWQAGPEGEQVLTVTGRYPMACQTQNWPVLWPDHPPEVSGTHSARLWQATWQQLGGTISGQVRDGAWPQGLQPWVTASSPPLSDVIRDINKFSNNVMARQLFLTLAPAARTDADSVTAAREFVTKQVVDATRMSDGHSPCDAPDALVLDNGAGLSRTEGASPRCMAAWLQALWRSPRMPEWLASLPVAGVDGTARRLQGAVGQAHLKTGSLDDVVALAGVVQSGSGRRHLLVAVVNDPQAEQARAAWPALLNWILQDTP